MVFCQNRQFFCLTKLYKFCCVRYHLPATTKLNTNFLFDKTISHRYSKRLSYMKVNDITWCVHDTDEILPSTGYRRENENWVTSDRSLRKKIAIARKKQNVQLRRFLRNYDEGKTFEDWNQLVESLVQLPYGPITEGNVYTAIMEECEWRIIPARKLLEYLKHKNIKFSLGVIFHFLSACHFNLPLCTDRDKKICEKFTNRLLKLNANVDPLYYIGQGILFGLAIQDDFKGCVENFEKSKKDVSAYEALTLCALRNGEKQYAWSLILNSFKKYYNLTERTMCEWIRVNTTEIEEIEKLLTLYQNHKKLLPQKICEELIPAYNGQPDEKKLDGTLTSVSHSGKCLNCGEYLDISTITEEEFKEIREAVFNRIMIFDDLFLQTTEEELKDFLGCIERNAPYDIVIDGSNLEKRGGSLQAFIEILTKFGNDEKRVFIVGKMNMQDKLQEAISSCPNVFVSTFMTMDDSDDDPFALYAAMYGGFETRIITADVMRQERLRLGDDRLRYLFIKWMKNRQILPIYTNGIIMLTPRENYIEEIQRSKDSGWHIPYETEDAAWNRKRGKIEKYHLHRDWLCLKRSKI